MTWPRTQVSALKAFNGVLGNMVRITNRVDELSTASLGGDTNRFHYIELLQTLRSASAVFTQALTVPGFNAVAQFFYGDSRNYITELTAVRDAADALADWIVTNFPTDAGSGAWLVFTYNSNGVQSSLVFTSAQTASFRTQADAFLATMD